MQSKWAIPPTPLCPPLRICHQWTMLPRCPHSPTIDQSSRSLITESILWITQFFDNSKLKPVDPLRALLPPIVWGERNSTDHQFGRRQGRPRLCSPRRIPELFNPRCQRLGPRTFLLLPSVGRLLLLLLHCGNPRSFSFRYVFFYL